MEKEQPGDAGRPETSLARDTAADKAVRFGCGALLAGLAFLTLIFFGLGEGIELVPVTVFGVVLVCAAGWAGVRYGDPFLKGLLEWLP